jgi:hypothetical protein
VIISSGFGLGENQVVWVVVGRLQDGIMTQKATKLDACATPQHSAALPDTTARLAARHHH